MRSRILPFVLLSLLSVSFTPVGGKKEAFMWSSAPPLSYSDFKGVPDEDHAAAMTSSAIVVRYALSSEKTSTTVLATFQPHDSWMRSNARNSYVLKHEQLHFDITEYNARLLRKALKGKYIHPRREQYLRDAINAYYDRWQKEQRLYDKQSRHGLDPAVQRAWEKKIAKGLKELEAYAL